MSTYYNFQYSTEKISYAPYLYNKKDTAMHFIAGITAFAIDGLASIFKLFDIGLGLFVGTLLILTGLYKVLIKNKTTLVFDKKNDSLYKISPLVNRKLIALSNIYSIITVSENMSYSYELTNKLNPSKKTIAITNFITHKTQNFPNIVFLETEIIPSIKSLINLKH